MDTKRAFKFLSDLDKNNNRDWFNENKEEYDILRKDWETEVQNIINMMSLYDNSLSHLDAKNCIYRIYRDIRFSPDKTPYKTYFSAVIGLGGRKCRRSCYYLHLQPGNKSGLFGGVWCPENKILRSLRDSIDNNFDEFNGIINEPKFKEFYNLIGDKLKTAPKGFDKNSPHIQYLKFKEYLLEHKLSDDFFYSNNWTEQVSNGFQLMLPFHQFMNYTIDEELL